MTADWRRGRSLIVKATSSVLLLFVLFAPAPARAQRSEALSLYKQGSVHYAAGRYRQAILHFERSLAIYRHKNTLYALGEAYRRSGKLRRSHYYYQRYASMLEGDERAAFEKKLAGMLGAALSDISITTDPPGATVAVDQEIRGSTPPVGALRLTLRPGTHAIVVRLAGYRPVAKAVEAQYGEPMALHLQLRPTAKRTPPSPEGSPGPEVGAFFGLLAGVATTDFSDRSLDVDPSFVIDLEGGANLFRRRQVGLTGSAALSYSGFKDGVVDDSAAFINLVFSVGGRINLGSRFWFELRFGLGPSFLVGAEPNNFLLQRFDRPQTITGLVVRPALCASWRLSRGVTLLLRLFTLDYSPRVGGFNSFAPSITGIKRYSFGLGLGWHS